MTEKNLQSRLTDLKDKVAMETSWSENLMDYLQRILTTEDLTLKQESICRLIYVLHEALFYKSYDLLTRSAITSNPKIRQHFIVKKREEIVVLKQKEEKVTVKTEENLTTTTTKQSLPVAQKLEQKTITVTGNTENSKIVKKNFFITEDDQLSESEIENIINLNNLRSGELCYRDIATIKIDKTRLQVTIVTIFTELINIFSVFS